MANITGTAKKAKVAKGVIDKVEDFFNHKDKAGKGAATATNAASTQNATNAANVVTGAKSVPPTGANAAADATKTTTASANIPNAAAKPQQQSPFDAAKSQAGAGGSQDKPATPNDATAQPQPNAADNTQQPAATSNDGAAQPNSAQDNAANNQNQNTPDANQPTGGDTTTPSTNTGGASGAAAGTTAATNDAGHHATGLKGKMEDAKTAEQAKVDGVKNAAQAKVHGVTDKVTNTVNGAKDKVSGGVNAVKDKASNAINTIKDPKAIAGDLAAGVAGKINGPTAKILESVGTIGTLGTLGVLGTGGKIIFDAVQRKGENNGNSGNYLTPEKDDKNEPTPKETTERQKPKITRKEKTKPLKKPVTTKKANDDYEPKNFIELKIDSWPKDENGEQNFFEIKVEHSNIFSGPSVFKVSFKSEQSFRDIKDKIFKGKEITLTFYVPDKEGTRQKANVVKSTISDLIFDVINEETSTGLKVDLYVFAQIYYQLHEFSSKKKKFFETETTLKAIFEKVFEDAKINNKLYKLPATGKFCTGYISSYDRKQERGNVTQYEETDWEFLIRVCKKYKLDYLINSDNIEENGRQIFAVAYKT